MKKFMRVNKKAFTLIELLAVIIILGVLLVIAIPSVTNYISDARKSSYISTAKNLVAGAKNYVNQGDSGMYDSDVTYYLDASCISVENNLKSPYGDFNPAYVVVTYEGSGYNYYWTSTDSSGHGVKNIVKAENLKEKDIETGIKKEDIPNNVGVGDRSYYMIIDQESECKKSEKRSVIAKMDEAGEVVRPICIRATTLHTEVCNSNSNFCAKKIGKGNTIIYGQLGDSKTLKTGDAFDCDLTGSGAYTERFYYVSDYYDTVNKTFDSDYAVLVYYTYYNNGATTNGYSYHSNNRNYEGPKTGINSLPTSSQWKNVELKTTERQILAITGTNTTTVANGKNLPLFSYEGKAARFLTVQEVMAGCGINNLAEGGTEGEIDNCTFLLEGSNFSGNGQPTYGPWLESVYPKNSTSAYRINSEDRTIKGSAANASNKGVKPTIDVPKIALSTDPTGSIVPVTVRFEGNGGTFGSNMIVNEVNYHPNSNNVISGTYKEPVKSGAEFAGWLDKDGVVHADISSMKFTRDSVFTAQWRDDTTYICKRVTDASKLHTETCNSTSNFCAKTVGKGNTITYGTAKEYMSELEAGDAFDCDLNGNGVYDQRFYYVSDYFDTNTKSFDSSYGVLVYYTYYSSSGPTTTGVAFNSSKRNYEGPVSLVNQMPSTTEWTNVKLKTTERQMLAEYNGTHSATTNVNGKILPIFSYAGKAARLLTVQEAAKGCGISVIKDGTAGELNNCSFLFEGSNFSGNGQSTYGPWFENPNSTGDDLTWWTSGYSEIVSNSATNNVTVSTFGVRPVIEIPYYSILY